MVEVQRRISRRSISKHVTGDSSNALSQLKCILSPEFTDLELDLQEEEEEGDEEPNYNNLLASLNSTEANTLQELRYLNSINLIKINNDEYENFKKYDSIIKESKLFLKPFNNYLTNFEKILKKLSIEMEFLEKRSNYLNNEINSKKLIDLKLKSIINDLIIPPNIIKSIIVDEINEKWCENIRFLNDKRQIYINYSQREDVKVKSLSELIKLLELLEYKSIERIRDYIILNIKLLRDSNLKPSQLIQKNLIEIKELFQFLKKKHFNLSIELRNAYIYTMRWYYYQNFVKYLHSIEKLNLIKFDKKFLINNTNYENELSDSNEYNFEYLNINKRLKILDNENNLENETVMLAQIADTNHLQYYIEYGFKNFNKAIIDNIIVEYFFIFEFFFSDIKDEAEGEGEGEVGGARGAGNGKDLEIIIDILNKIIFKSIYQLSINYTKFLINFNSKYDIFGILIMIKLIENFENSLTKINNLPLIMENFFNLQNINLWTNFQKLIDLNIDSLKNISLSKFYMNGGGSGDGGGNNLVIPIKLTQTFSIFLENLLKLTYNNNSISSINNSDPLINSINNLILNFEIVLTKISKKNQGNKKELFLYNNYFLISTILNEIDINNEIVDKTKKHFIDLVNAYNI
ncbi:hypothetical protein BVG19_g4890 [[Candida] boidinii]|nr:hypothetical protein BVG19_g4890 [[Candida] boidinii]OWB53506.1 hypothetical protein B5S27_g5106 [[Candida] boidinii]